MLSSWQCICAPGTALELAKLQQHKQNNEISADDSTRLSTLILLQFVAFVSVFVFAFAFVFVFVFAFVSVFVFVFAR